MEKESSDDDSEQELNILASSNLSLLGYEHSHVLTKAQQNYYRIPYFFIE